jgi:anti-sigma factor RsiW
VSPGRDARRADDHGAFDELAVGWALHSLEPEDEAVFVRHLPDCARCAHTVAETAEVMGAMAADLPPVEPPAPLRDRLRAAVERTERTPSSSGSPGGGSDLDDLDELFAPPGPVPPRRTPGFPLHEPGGAVGVAGERPTWRRVLPSAFVAATVAAILGLSTWSVFLGDARDRAQATVAEQSAIMDALLRPGEATIAPVAGQDGRTVATIVARHGQVQVVTTGLTVNDATKSVYVLWGMRNATPVALGTFDVVQPRMDLRTVGSDQTGLDGYPAYAISIEPGRQAPGTPSAVVANGQVTS